jgi:hypothetical protein
MHRRAWRVLPRVGRICVNRRRHPCRLSWRRHSKLSWTTTLDRGALRRNLPRCRALWCRGAKGLEPPRRQRGGQPSPAARHRISASRSQMAFDSVAFRLTAPLLKLSKVAKPGHRPHTSTIRPCSRPDPASRSGLELLRSHLRFLEESQGCNSLTLATVGAPAGPGCQ